MRLGILIILLLCQINVKAQSGFLQGYDLGEAGLTLHNMLLVEDTLVLCGKIAVESRQQWGLLLVKMDTFGQILDHRIHFDERGDNYSFEQAYQMIKTRDGGYALVGQMFNRQYPVLIKLDVHGDMEFVQEYPDTTVYDIRHWDIIETHDGFMSAGVKQQRTDAKWDTFIMRTDANGEKIWEISYGEDGVWDLLSGVQRLSSNEYLLTGATYINGGQVDDLADMWLESKAIIIDTFGNIREEWSGERYYVGGSNRSINRLKRSYDNHWVAEGSNITVVDEQTIVAQGEIAKFDNNYNQLWSTSFGSPTSNRNNFTNLTQAPDSGWVAVGQYVEPLGDGSGVSYWAGMMAKVDQDGDSLWSRLDTLFSHTAGYSRANLSGVVALPSGSIVACGHVDRWSPAPRKSFGWVIKVDKDGCIASGCNPISDSKNLSPLFEYVKIFPNPTTDYVNITYEENNYMIELYNLNGQILEKKSNCRNTEQLNLTPYPKGIYFVEIQRKDGSSLTKMILKK